jgi:DDB1- and CUL4-associated factor 11
MQDKRRIGGSMVPRCGKLLEHYRSKVFCGVYGRDGDIFLTAAQDKKIRIYDTRWEPGCRSGTGINSG